MSVLRPPDPVKPVVAVFAADRTRIAAAAARLAERFGPIEYIGPELVFDQTDYYAPEMGGPLVKRLLAVEGLMDPADLVELKVFCAGVEAELSVAGRRTVNLDPGYVGLSQLVLATGKSAAHRLYLGRGVYGEATLAYEQGGFKTLPWTYPDFADARTMAAVADVRRRYVEQLRDWKRGET